MNLTTLIPLLIDILCVALFAVLMRSKTTRSLIFFRLVVVFMFLWTLSILLTETSNTNAGALLWSRLSFFFADFITLSLYPFALAFSGSAPKKGPFPRKYYVISGVFMGLGVLLAGISLTPLILKSVVDKHSQFGPLQPVYGIYMLASYLFIGIVLRKARALSVGRTRTQLEVILLGIVISAFLIIVFNIFFPLFHIGEIRYLGPLSLLVFMISTAYAIISQHLFDIRLIIKRTLVYSVLLAAVLATYTLVVFILSSLFSGQFTFDTHTFFAYLIAALLISLGFDPLRRKLQDITERFLFKKEYEEQAVLKNLTQKLNNVVGLDDALEALMQSLVKAMHLRHAVTFVFQHGENKTTAISRIKQIGYSNPNKLMLEEKDFTVEFFTKSPSVLIVDDLEQSIEKEQILFKRRLKTTSQEEQAAFVREHAVKRSVLKKLRSVDAAVAVPLHIETQPIGLIFLSSKLSQEEFSREDIALIDIVGSQAVSSIQKARLFEGDQMKTEFVSIASHELLTPVSAMEGYLSMILDENLGKIDPQAREYLTKVYSSAKRLSTLIKDLLSVSRLEAGRMKIAPQSVDLAKMVTETIDQLRFIAEGKSLQLVFDKPKTPLPPAYVDPDRLMEVLINLVGNAIKYTPAGTVTIRLSKHTTDGMLNVEVEDTGLGMSKEQRVHLFEKFYRIYSEETANITGTGLGLYITKSVVEKSGGNLTLHSTPRKGSTFSFTVPMFKVELSTIS